MPASISLDDAAAARAWFSGIVEPLSDSFDAGEIDRYVALFTSVVERAHPALKVSDLRERYARIRRERVFAGPDPEDVFVLSRVTLGADIAVTSVLLDAAKRRFPNARIWFTGSRKGWELFCRDARIRHAPAGYGRTASIRERIDASLELASVVDTPHSIVVDPDSRLTQLGLIPVCAEARYFFFESRGSLEPGSLGELAARWAGRTFAVEQARGYMAAPEPEKGTEATITVSLGVGENAAKRVADPFERKLLEGLAELQVPVLVDQGAGGEETERVLRAAAGLPNVRLFEGSFAAFAGHIAASQAYVGYDSAGQHAAAAAGVALTAVFAGYPNARFVERWRPTGAGTVTVLPAAGVDPEALARAAVTTVSRSVTLGNY